MPNTNPQAVTVANAKIRPLADIMAGLYNALKSAQIEYIAENWPALFPADTEVIVDGSATDGRTPITNSDVRNFMLNDAVQFLNFMEANTFASRDRVFKIAPNPAVMVFMLAAVALSIVAPVSAESPIDTLSPGQWYEVPNSRLDQSGQLPTPIPPGASGYAAIMTAWSGGVYDSKRDRLIVTGGGHADYAGNEIYAFDLTSLTWTRIWGPTPNAQIQALTDPIGEAYLNGDPRQVHTYNGLVYLPTQDLLWRHGGSLWSATGGGSIATWVFDFATNTWTRKSDVAGQNVPTATYDPVTGNVFLHKYAYLWEYNPTSETFTRRSTQSAGYSPTAAAAIDQGTRQFVFIGDGQVYSYHLDTYPTTLVLRTTTGANEVVTNNSRRPGLAWDSAAQKLVAWNGGTAVYTLDTATWVWTKHDAAATNTVTPSAPTSGGVLGRWQYLPAHNAYVVVNAISGSVYFYRLATTASPSAPSNVSIRKL